MKKRRYERFLVFALVLLLIADPFAFAEKHRLPNDVPGQVNGPGTGHWAVVRLKDGHQLKGTRDLFRTLVEGQRAYREQHFLLFSWLFWTRAAPRSAREIAAA